jgi:hypothetical protein
MRFVYIAVLTSVALPVAFSQQQQSTFVRDFCVKVRDGKENDFRGYLRDVSAKLAQVRVNDGRLQWWIAEEAVVPGGESARCDYHLVSGYNGFPSEPSTNQTGGDFERAKINRADATARRDSTSRLVSVDIWRVVGSAGATAREGSYVRHNFYKVKPGHTVSDWVKLENSGWKPFAEALGKEKDGLGWVALGLILPGGEHVPYNGMTIDLLPDWKTIGEGLPFTSVWPKVHPDLDFSAYMNLVSNTVERRSVELYKAVHVIRK